MNATANQDFYLNFSQFHQMKQDARQHADGAQEAAAQQFESLFIQQMLKEMRSAAVVDEEQHSSYMDFYTDMYDKQIALMMSKNGGIGIAKHLQSQLDQTFVKPDSSANSTGKYFPLEPKIADAMPIKQQGQGMAYQPHNEKTAFAFNGVAVKPLAAVTATAYHPASAVTASQATARPYVDHVQTVQAVAMEQFHQIDEDIDNSQVKLNALNSSSAVQTALSDESIKHHKGWSNPVQFVQDLMPYAMQASTQLGVDAKVLVAQSALETGWGKYTMRHDDGRVAFSLFGIKADQRWSGDTVEVMTHEYRNGRMQKQVAEFRAYDSVGEAMQDYVDFIQGNQRYQEALANSADQSHYVNGLQKAGYATDPHYANKILNIVSGDTLKDGLATLDIEPFHSDKLTTYKEVA